MIAYADDTEVTIGANNRESLIRRANKTMEIFTQWAEKAKLIFTPDKCQMMLLKCNINLFLIKVMMGNTKLQFALEIRYLGRVVTTTPRSVNALDKFPLQIPKLVIRCGLL